MMISAVRIPSNTSGVPAGRRGFTLLEAILAMVLMLIVITVGLSFVFTANDKEILRKAAVRIEAMASQGHAMSVLHQKPFWLRFEEGQIVLAGADVRSQPAGESMEGGAWLDESVGETHEEIYDTYPFEATSVSVRRWGTAEGSWVQPVEDEFLVWHFQSTGLCEPISIKLETEESYIILHMNPLTARVDEEETMIR